MTIPVPDLAHPVLCWRQAPDLVRCVYPKYHTGPHSWERRLPGPRAAPVVAVWSSANVVLITPQPSQIAR